MFQAISLAVIVVLTLIDQLTKYIAVSTVKVDGAKEFLFGTFQFRYVENTGAAFSSFSDNTNLLSAVTFVIIVFCLILLLSRKIKPMFVNICLLLVTAGGIGNLIDRIMYGYVIDFIEPLFIDFAVFNFADCCITVGAFMLIGYEIFDLIKEQKNKKKND